MALGETHAGFWQRHRWLKWVGAGVLVLLVAVGVAVSVALHRAEPFVRARIVQALEDRFRARVELDSFHMSLAGGLRAEGHGLRIWPPATVAGVTVPGTSDTSNPNDPLIALEDFRFRAPLHYEPGKPFHVSMIQLTGLEIHLPPRSRFLHAAGAERAQPDAARKLLAFNVGRIECTDAHLVLGTSKPGKVPLDFAIARFTLTGSDGGSINIGQPMRFDAELTNPKPVGLIHSTGEFGPWMVGDPGESPIEGEYQFDHADLASFKGIAGILSSTGKYEGTLRDLTVDGDTDTPDFRLTHFGNALPLHTHFHAKVDATNGDTWLEPVDAVLGHSHFTAQGQVVRVPDPNAPADHPASMGHDIALDIHINGARMDDFLRLASKDATTPLLSGALAMKAALHIPPGPAPVHERMTLKGNFNLDEAHFTSDKIQDRITELSLRGQGLPKQIKRADSSAVRSTMTGEFQMAKGVITLPSLIYMVPGANIELKGTYGMDGGALDFAGVAKLDATVSKMVGGVFGVLLKPADRFFKKDGAGTEVPIHISGTRQDPKFGVDFGRKRQKPESPPPPPPDKQ